MRYVSQLKRNLISVGTLEALGLVISVRDGVLKMIKGSIVMMKGVRRDNLYYLKSSTVTGQVETSNSLDDGCKKVWQVKVGHGGERSLQLLQRRDRWKVLLPATWWVNTAFWTRKR